MTDPVKRERAALDDIDGRRRVAFLDGAESHAGAAETGR